MSDTSSPTVWRRWLAFELARLRQENGLDQKDVAKALRCTVGKVSYYETAERPVVLRDLDEVLLPLYKVPKDRWPVYLQAAKDSRKKGWWESYSADTLPSWLSLYVGLEQGAGQLRIYQAQLIPGLLQ
ncbi:MAG TPA: helix-turn-helix domain-containing protein, partial [Pseudonocardiaceae bacterium]